MRGLIYGVLALFAVQALHPFGHAAAQARDDAASDQPSEIIIERIYGGCEDCPDRKVVLRREGGKKFQDATVTQIDLHTKIERRGKLRAYYYNHLLKLVESQGVFGMKDEYAMGWVDSVIVTLGVTNGDKRKVIRTRNEGEVPIQLWGIYYAIDGAVGNVKWESAP